MDEIAHAIEKDIQDYITEKWGNVCDIDFCPKRQFVIVSPESGDWEALYMDGKLIAEGHSLRVIDVLDAIADVLLNEVSYDEISDERAENGFDKYLCNMLPFKYN